MNNIKDILTKREREISLLIMSDFTGVAIAKKLGISRNTVDCHIANIKRKTGSKTFAGIVSYIIKK